MKVIVCLNRLIIIRYLYWQGVRKINYLKGSKTFKIFFTMKEQNLQDKNQFFKNIQVLPMAGLNRQRQLFEKYRKNQNN